MKVNNNNRKLTASWMERIRKIRMMISRKTTKMTSKTTRTTVTSPRKSNSRHHPKTLTKTPIKTLSNLNHNKIIARTTLPIQSNPSSDKTHRKKSNLTSFND